MTELITYPSGDLDRVGLMKATYGTFWDSIFEDQTFLSSFVRGQLWNYQQAYQDRIEAFAALSRWEVPIYHEETRMRLNLRERDMQESAAALPRYGEDNVYGQSGLFYGRAQANPDKFIFPLPGSNIRGIKLISDALTEQQVVFVEGVDYALEPDLERVVFYRNPFGVEELTPVEEYDQDGLPNRVLSLWADGVSRDEEFIWELFGYVVKVRLPSTIWYRNFVNALWSQHVAGPSDLSFRRAFAAAMGIPLVSSAEETVDTIIQGKMLHIVTETTVYTFEPTATPQVAVGDTVVLGDSMIEGFDVFDLSGHGVDYSELRGITLEDRFLSQDKYRGGLFFKNESVELQYLGIDEDGFAEVRFEVSGYEEDVEAWWTSLHANGKAQENTLAHMLDTREDGNGEPLGPHLPATVNPMGLMMDLMGNSLLLVKIRFNDLADDAPGFHALSALRNALAPHVSYVLFIELELETESVTMGEDVEQAVASLAYYLPAETVPQPVEHTPLFNVIAGIET